MQALLVASGDLDLEVLKEYSSVSNFIVAIDGGINHCFEANIRPDLVIGDLDSISPSNKGKLEKENIEVLIYPEEKDATDLEIAVDYSIDQNFTKTIILGSTGSRLDHSLAAIGLLDKFYKKDMEAYIVNKKNICFLLSGERNVSNIKKYVSLIPMERKGMLVTLEGFKYPLKDDFIEFSSTRCISNEILGDSASIKIKNGLALVILSED